MDLFPMYEAMINSPILQLKTDISATATQFTVTNTDCLPDAPNIVTFIGEDENDTETVMYTEKTANMLRGVQRGFQGAAKAWIEGTRMARLYTTYDHDTFIKNIEKNNAALEDIANRLGNPNILHNWDFRNPVNQRRQDSYPSGYTVDRWKIISPGTGSVEVVSGGIKLKSGLNQWGQGIEFPTLFPTATYTLSAIVDGVLYKGSGVVNSSVDSAPISINIGDGAASLQIRIIPTDPGINRLGVRFFTITRDIVIERVKLELGSVSTLANDPPQDYGVELAKCQRYCIVYNEIYTFAAISTTITANDIRFRIMLPNEMRINPTINMDALTLWDASGVQLTGFTFQKHTTGNSGKTLGINAVKTAHGITPTARVTLMNGDIFILDANL